VTLSLAQLFFLDHSAAGIRLSLPYNLSAQLSSFGLLKNRHYLFVDSRPKILFRSLPAYFISDHSLKLKIKAC
jgi:hypothetical protein